MVFGRSFFVVEANRAELTKIGQLIDEGHLRPLVLQEAVP